MTGVGAGLRAALDRARVHERIGLSDGRQIAVKFALNRADDPRYDGLVIMARTRPRDDTEAALLNQFGWRTVPWTLIDDAAGELSRLVDECVADLERLFGEARVA